MNKRKIFALYFLLFTWTIPDSVLGQDEPDKNSVHYICPMYCTDLISSEPGSCPVCSMNLEDRKIVENPPDYKLITPEELNNLMESKEDIYLLDVRTENEFDGELKHLDNALLIPIKELEKRLDELSTQREKKIIVYCSHGIRSARGAKLLQQNGYQAFSLVGGLTKWYWENPGN